MCLTDFLQECKNNSMEERQTFKQMVLEQLDGYPQAKEIKKTKTIKIFEVNMSNKLSDFALSNTFSYVSL